MGPTNTHLAVLGDVVGSRHVEDREGLRQKLRSGLLAIRHSPPWLSMAFARQPDPDDSGQPVWPEISAGDEIQLLLRVEDSRLPGTPAIGVLDLLAAKLRPYRMAFGLGIGTLATRPSGPGPVSVQELDGSCFHRARMALERAKRGRRWAVVIATDADHPDTEVEVAVFERAANAILRLTGDIRAGWTDRQTKVVRHFAVDPEDTPLQKEVAETLQVSPSVISEVLRAARHDAVHEADLAVGSLLNHMALPAAFRRPEEEKP